MQSGQVALLSQRGRAMLRVLSVVSFNFQRSFFIISYFDFGFTSAYNSILFCCLQRNVEPCCHTHDSRSAVTVYSARPRLVGLALYTVIACRALSSNTRSKQKPAAKCDIQTMVQQLLIAKPDIR